MLHSRDTSPDARRALLERLRRATPEECFRMAADLTDFTWLSVRASVERDFRDLGAAERHARFIERWVGGELGRRAAAHYLRTRAT